VQEMCGDYKLSSAVSFTLVQFGRYAVLILECVQILDLM